MNGRRKVKQEEFLAGRDWQVATLQEVTTSTFEGFSASAGASGAAAFQHGDVTKNPRWLYAAVLVRPPLEVLSWRPLPGATSPERTLVAEVSVAGRTITVASLAAPPASIRKWTPAQKVDQLRAIRRLAEQTWPLLIGIDQNGPDVDHPDLRRSRWHNEENDEDILFGQEAVDAHGLRDVFRTYLEQRPDRLERIRGRHPDGPLAVSYLRGPARTPCRYDLIAASPEFRVVDVTYLTDDSYEAGSDHAAITAVLELS